MDDLISRETLAEEIASMKITMAGRNIFPQGVKDCILEHIHDAPAVDAVLVVRCHECKHQIYDQKHRKRWCNHESGCREVRADGQGYCDLGARIDGVREDG
ncbi:hypothetical protein [Intestinibacillus massiliensis]|uniref:hypothetical protein n=1 Tax=Intestinibacillus massiliensis TaxID=1871029 RepID=UPI000B34CD72|nr:hypothetical protein [Intestinibacillus massiliensis]